MWLSSLAQNRIALDFEYWRIGENGEELIARCQQEVACMRREGKGMVPTAMPEELREAIRLYAEI